MFRLQSGHSSDYSDGLNVQDVQMAYCFETVQSLSKVTSIILSFQTVWSVQTVQTGQIVHLL
jgi:hypothetical protein